MSDRCIRCGSNPPGFEGRVPFRDELREQVAGNVCADCWRDWLQVQIKVINEFALNLGDIRSHDIIEAHARDFFKLQEGASGTDLERLGDKPPA